MRQIERKMRMAVANSLKANNSAVNHRSERDSL